MGVVNLVDINLNYQSYNSDTLKDLERFSASSIVDKNLISLVTEILEDVKNHGNRALFERTLLYDKASLKESDLMVSGIEFESANASLETRQRKAIEEAIENVSIFHRQNLPEDWKSKNLHGATVGENYYPIRRVGIYIPGGNVPLVSTVVMTVTLAKVAGVEEIVVATPPNEDGSIASELLAALQLLGVQEVYKIGGAQAIGALAHGTETITPVDKIYGPGNAYVNEAKRQVFGVTGIDLLPGPSEVMVIADKTSNPSFVAAALLAQAEHGSGKEKIYLIFTEESMFKSIASEINNQVGHLGHKEAVLKILKIGFFAVYAHDLKEVVDLANFIAPEHLELQVENQVISYLQKNITTAGALLLGHFSATALGDFVAGPSHVLPTGRSSRFSSGLRIEDFFRRTSIICYDPKSVAKAKESAVLFSEMERLDAHGNSISLRLKVDEEGE